MICCFMNLHEKENAKDLSKHFDKEIEIAIGRDCSVFVAGTNYPEDILFEERVREASKFYEDGDIRFLAVENASEDELASFFIQIADWEIYSYET